MEIFQDGQLFFQFGVILAVLVVVMIFAVILGVSFVRANLEGVPPEKQFFLVNWKWFLSPVPGQGHFIARMWEQGIWARPYGPGWHFIFLVNWFGEIQPHKLVELSPEHDGEENTFALVRAKDGNSLSGSQVTQKWFSVESLLDGEDFLRGGGDAGIQLPIFTLPFSTINPELFELIPIEPVEIKPEMHENPDRPGSQPILWPKLAVITMNIGLEVPEEGGLLIAPPPQPMGDFTSHDNFQNLEAFLAMGGRRGVQPEFAGAGKYIWNTAAVHHDLHFAFLVEEGQVGVLVSSIGLDPENEDLVVVGLVINGKAAKLGTVPQKGDEAETVYILNPTKENLRGIQGNTLGPGFHLFNPVARRGIAVDTTPRAVSWDGKEGKGGKEFVPIKVVTKDKFQLELMPELSYQTTRANAPKLVALARSQRELELEIINPQGAGVILEVVSKCTLDEFLSRRRELEEGIRQRLQEVLDIYYVTIQELRISAVKFSPEAEKNFRLSSAVTNAVQEKLAVEAETSVAKANVELQRQKALAALQTIVADAELRKQAAENIAEAISTKAGPLKDILAGISGEGAWVKSLQMILADPSSMPKVVEAISGFLGMLPGFSGQTKQLSAPDQTNSTTTQ